MEDVKNFLVEYCNERKQSGYLMLPDPLSIFYDALFVGLDRHSSSTPANPNMQPPMTNPGWFLLSNEFQYFLELLSEEYC